jgi:hypothetical protein
MKPILCVFYLLAGCILDLFIIEVEGQPSGAVCRNLMFVRKDFTIYAARAVVHELLRKASKPDAVAYIRLACA